MREQKRRDCEREREREREGGREGGGGRKKKDRNENREWIEEASP